MSLLPVYSEPGYICHWDLTPEHFFTDSFFTVEHLYGIFARSVFLKKQNQQQAYYTQQQL